MYGAKHNRLGRLSKKVGVIAAIAVIIAGFLALLALGLVNREPATGRSGITRVEKPAMDFTLPLFGGGEFALREHRGQPVVINFWASWCPPCRQEAHGLERAWRSHASEGVVFVGVDIQDSEGDARAYIQEFGITYPNGPDTDGQIAVDYGVIGIPVTFLVNKEGTVEQRWVGALDETQLAAWIDELAAGMTLSGEAEGENPQDFFKLDR